MPDLLRFIWARADTREPSYTDDEVKTWPPGVMGQLTSHGILRLVRNASAVVCDACGGDHVEEVLYVESPPGTGLRAYIRCPEAGRVGVPLERLRRWEVCFDQLAELTATALGTRGKVEEVIPSRVWLIGKATFAGRSREVFLARGLSWPDAAALVGGSPRLGSSVQPVILVPGSVPPPAVWPGNSSRVLPLSALLSWNGSGPVLDQSYLDTVFTQDAEINPKRAQATNQSLETNRKGKVPPASRVQRDKKSEARNKWIYRLCCQGKRYKEIIAELKQCHREKGWQMIGTKQGIQSAARRYAERHGLEPPPARQNL